MSAGKKKSGFQITSVTSDYGQASGESTPVQRASLSAESGGPQVVIAGKEAVDALQGATRSRTGADVGTGPDEAGDYKPAYRAGSTGGDEVGGAKVPNGPALLDVIRRMHTSTSQPSTPAAVRRHMAAQELGVGSLSPQASRFRVVRLGQGLGEPYRRGRWTCVDFMDREGGEERGLRRVMDSMRHAHSLESLETVGLGGAEGAREGALLKPLGHMGALRSANLVHSQGTTHVRAPHLVAEGREHADAQVCPPSATGHTSSSGPSSPSPRFSVTPVNSASPCASLSSPPAHLQELQPRSPPPYLAESTRPRHIPPPLRLDMDTSGRPLFRETLSQPSSPGPTSSRDRASRQSANPVPTPSAFSLAQSMFGVGGAFDLSDESGSSNSTIAIDNKIEQAMDLVKTHLMMAVREEVEVLREQIKELAERNAQLERENYILRALRERD